MRNFLRHIRRSRFNYSRLVDVRIYREAIIHNLNEFKRKYETFGIAPVLKSNAYGHGLMEVANIADTQKVPFLCVDSYFEALILRNENINSKLLVLGYSPIENLVRSSLPRVSFSIIDIAQLEELSKKLDKPINFHLEIDTGMHRHGIQPEDLSKALDFIEQNKNINLEGVFTHFADAETPDSSLTSLQLERWHEAVGVIKDRFTDVEYFHCGGSNAGFYNKNIDANVLRIGKGFYGVNVGQDKLDLMPALTMVSRITSIRKLKAGERIGYNGTFEAQRDISVATIPVGYAEGLDKRLSNKGVVTVRGVDCPIVGRVSMNISSIDISSLPEAQIGDEVIVISRDPDALNSILKMADACDTIPYEIMVHVPAQLRRTVISQGE